MCSLITDNPVTSCQNTQMAHWLSNLYVADSVGIKNKRTFNLTCWAGESAAVGILISKIHEIPQRCWKHICSPLQSQIMRLLKNRTTKERKKEKLVYKTKFVLRHLSVVPFRCSRATLIVQLGGHRSKQKVLSGTSGHVHRLLALRAQSYQQLCQFAINVDLLFSLARPVFLWLARRWTCCAYIFRKTKVSWRTRLENKAWMALHGSDTPITWSSFKAEVMWKCYCSLLPHLTKHFLLKALIVINFKWTLALKQ